MTDDFEGLAINPFGDDKPKRAPTKRKRKRKTNTTKSKSHTSDPFSNGGGLVFDPYGNSSGSSKNTNTEDDLGFDGLIQAGMGIKNTVDVIKTAHQNRKRLPSDPDHILVRAKNIRAREKKKRDVEKARNYIIDENNKKDMQRRHDLYDKHGYVKGKEIFKNESMSKAEKIRKLLRR